MNLLPQGFQFSQRSLQDYVDCRRRFQLRYIDGLAWPAVESEPLKEHESQLQAGAAFHRLVQRYLVGIPAERLSPMLAARGSLQRWWENFIQFSGVSPQGDQLVEITLSAPLHKFRLLAKYDLLSWEGEPGSQKIKIYDWKTSQKRPSREWLEKRLQTRVYPYLLAQAGHAYIGGVERLLPEQVEMVYWFAEKPRQPQVFAYSQQQFQEDQEYLLGLVKEIEGLKETDFFLTEDEASCKFCTYRSLCDRGISAGGADPGQVFDKVDGSGDIELDFDQIAEIEF